MLQLSRALVAATLAVGTLFLIFLALSGFDDLPSDRAPYLARTQFALRASAQVIGLVVAAVALLGLLQQADRGDRTEDPAAFGLCVLGGVLLVEPHWAVALMFGLLALVRVVERASRRGNPRRADDPASSQPPR